MSVSIRLAKFGKKHAPSYRVVVTKTRTKRNGAFIDIIGHYNPSDHTKEFTIDKKIYEEWVGKGAIVSDAVKQLVDGTYEYIKYEPKKANSKESAESGSAEVADKKEVKEVKEEAPAEEPVKEEKKEEKPEVKEETKKE